MRCPFCERALRPETHPEVEVDRCPTCSALWFDAGELPRYQRARHGCAPEPIEVRHLQDGRAPLRCPRCATDTLVSCQVRHISARHCVSCDGLAIQAAPLVAPRGGASRALMAAAEGAANGAVFLHLGEVGIEAVLETIAAMLEP